MYAKESHHHVSRGGGGRTTGGRKGNLKKLITNEKTKRMLLARHMLGQRDTDMESIVLVLFPAGPGIVL